MTSMQNVIIEVCLLLSLSNYVACLMCYKCANIEIKSKGSMLFDAFDGKSDPSCGVYPTDSNIASCGDDEVCGSVKGDLSAIQGLFESKVQIRGCLPRSALTTTYTQGGMISATTSSVGGCSSTDSLSNAAIGRLLGVVTQLPDVKFKGEMCTCDFDYCALCDGGVEIGGYCMKYWLLGLIGVGTLVAIIGVISCCCCCCGCCGCCACCRKGSPGVVHSHPYHTLTVIQTPGAPPPLSIQSGDIIHPSTNQAEAVGGAYPSGATGLVEDRERVGYNQEGDKFGASLS